VAGGYTGKSCARFRCHTKFLQLYLHRRSGLLQVFADYSASLGGGSRCKMFKFKRAVLNQIRPALDSLPGDSVPLE
jgi:hypothetical protein